MKKLGERLLDCIYPGSIYCICCGNLIDSTRSYSLCDHCITHIRWNGENPIVHNEIEYISCVNYGIYERSIIFALKYDGHRYISRNIAEIMRDRLDMLGKGFDQNWLVAPIPLHDRKMGERGFNQAELIGRNLAKLLQIPFVDALRRNKYTVPMRSLGPEERKANIYDALEIKGPREEEVIAGKNILLVDDFFTTGSTIGASAEVLREAGAKEIIALVFAARENIDTI